MQRSLGIPPNDRDALRLDSRAQSFGYTRIQAITREFTSLIFLVSKVYKQIMFSHWLVVIAVNFGRCVVIAVNSGRYNFVIVSALVPKDGRVAVGFLLVHKLQ